MPAPQLNWQSMILIAFIGVFGSSVETKATPSKKYLTYEMFKSLISLCPEVKNPALAGLSSAGQELWSKGQMRIPAETHLFEGDFNHDSKPEAAIVITDSGKQFLVVAEHIGKNWRRTGFVRIVGAGISEFNGRSFVLDETSFVAWDGKCYKLERGALALYCNGYKSSDFTGVSIKLTYVGPQEKPYPGLWISSYYRWTDLNKFKPYRKASASYANDEIPVMWHLTVPPEDLRNVILYLNHSRFIAMAEDRNGTDGAVWHSLSILDESSPIRPNYFEVFLKGNETVELLTELSVRMEKKNADGAKLLLEYAKMFGK